MPLNYEFYKRSISSNISCPQINSETLNHFPYAELEDLARKIANACGIPDAYSADRIVKNGPATIVFWKDGTKTVVKHSDNDPNDLYYAFCAALAKKVYGNNSRIKKILSKTEDCSKEKSK